MTSREGQFVAAIYDKLRIGENLTVKREVDLLHVTLKREGFSLDLYYSRYILQDIQAMQIIVEELNSQWRV